MRYSELWGDVPADMTAVKVSTTNPPTWAQFRNGIYTWSFSASTVNEVWVKYQIHHDYVPGSPVYPLLYWSVSTTNTGVVRWGIEYTIAKGHQQQAFPITSTIYLNVNVAGIAYRNYTTEVPEANAIPATNLEPDSLILMRVFRDAAHSADTLVSPAFLLHCSMHCRKNRDGTTRNKVPDFYA
jgi:hypothetical protein